MAAALASLVLAGALVMLLRPDDVPSEVESVSYACTFSDWLAETVVRAGVSGGQDVSDGEIAAMRDRVSEAENADLQLPEELAHVYEESLVQAPVMIDNIEAVRSGDARSADDLESTETSDGGFAQLAVLCSEWKQDVDGLR